MNTANNIDLDNTDSVHIIGIGGIGVSAAARFFLDRGADVSGSDLNGSAVTDGLAEAGVEVSVGHDATQVPENCDLVIHTIAIPETNPELQAAETREIPTLTYPEFLGLLSEDYFTIAVSGTHGKTTTTAMLADILQAADLDPTVIVGSLLGENGSIGSNFIAGDDNDVTAKPIFLVEACEYQESFLELVPDILVITNIDYDHVDYYEDIATVQAAFQKLVKSTGSDRAIITDPKDDTINKTLADVSCKIVSYQKEIDDLDLKIPGEFNKRNAQAAIATFRQLVDDAALAKRALEEFPGTWRRQEYKGETAEGTLVYDDYGHHPEEVRANVSGFQNLYPDKKIVVVFQPHQFSRTASFLDEFGQALAVADQILLLPIYTAREADDGTVSSADLLQRLPAYSQLVDDFAAAEAALEDLAGSDSVIITQGAGDVHKLANRLVKK